MTHDINVKFLVHAPEDLSLCCDISSSPEKQCLACKEVMVAEKRVRDASDALELALQARPRALNQRNARHSPFNLVPIEIACRIFSLCFDAMPTPNEFYRTTAPWGHHRQGKKQLVLGAVCQDWRRIIWSNPSFWNVITLTVTPSTPANFPIITQQWLDRSGTLPLAICLAVSPQDQSTSPVCEALDPLIETLNSVADRWHCVDFNIPVPYISKFRSTRPSPIKALTLTPLDDRPIGPQRLNHKPHTVFNIGSAPSPSHLRISGCSISNLHVLWDKVTSFDGEDLTTSEVLEVLGHSPLMRKCRLYVYNPGEDPTMTPTVIHDCLRILRIEGDIVSLFSGITCPSLQEMVLTFVFSGEELQSDIVRQFVARSSFPLVSLSLIGMNNPDIDEDLIRILSLIPSLKDLFLTNQIGQELLTHLRETAWANKHDPLHSRFLPRLQSFRYHGCRGFSWSLIPALFPPEAPSPTHNTRRPLYNIEITIDYILSDGEGCTAEDAIAHDTIDLCDIERILEIQDEGVTISISEENGMDVLGFWTGFYGIDESSG